MAVQEKDDVQDVEVIDQQDEQAAAEEAGFAEAFGGPPVAQTAETTEPADENEPEQDEVEVGAQPEATEETPEQQAAADHEHLKTLLDSLPELSKKSELTDAQIRQLNGKLGEINRLVQDLKVNKAAAPAGVKITKDTFKRLNTDFPEIAEMLAEDLAAASFPSEAAPAVDVQPLIDAEVKKVRQEMSASMEVRLLAMQHKDWHAVVNSPEFKTWKAALPQADQTALNDSWDAGFIADRITDFKTSKKKQSEIREQRNDRLTRGMLPKTTVKASRGLTTEEDGFNAAFT